MTTTSSVTMTSRLVGLRLHTRRGPGGAPESPRARALLDLEAERQQRELDRESVRALLAEAGRQVDAIPGVLASRMDDVAGMVVELGLAVAKELVGAALHKGLVDPTPTVVRCLADCVHGSDRGDLVVKLHPQDLDVVERNLVEMPEVRDEYERARFVADASVPRGGVRAETGAGRLRYDPVEVLARISDEVRREANA